MMRRPPLLAILLASLVLATACRTKDEATRDDEHRTRKIRSAPAADERTDEEKMVAYTEGVADIIDAEKDDCDQMAVKLTAFQKKYGAEMKKMQKKMQDTKTQADIEKAVREKYGARLEAAM